MGDSLIKESNSQEEPEEKVFSIPVPELNMFRRITRNYARQLGVLPTATLLPRRRIRKLTVNEVGDYVEVQTLEDLVDHTLHEINGPVRQISPSRCNLENEQTNEDLSIDWPQDRGNQNHPESSKIETYEFESLDSEEEEMEDEKLENNNNDNQ